MKKLLVLLLIVVLVAFSLVGCVPATPAEGKEDKVIGEIEEEVEYIEEGQIEDIVLYNIMLVDEEQVEIVL
jgi:hypothetical protein